MSEDDIHQHRLAERQLEYRQRRMDLELAAEGIVPAGLDPKVPVQGARQFVESIQGVDAQSALATVAAVHSQGYAVAPLLTAATVTHLRQAMAPFFAATAALYAGDQTIHVQNVLGKSDVADSVAVHGQLRAIVAGILGHDFILNAGAVAMAPDPGCNPQGLHRDDGFYALIARPHLPLVVTVAIALDDFSMDNGATQVVPGSQCWPADRHPEPDEVESCSMPAGSMLVWDGAMYHGGGGNRTSQQTRRTLTFNYTRGWLRTQFNQYLSIPRQRVLDMPPALQADLGYHRSALGLGACDHQDALGYLQRLQEAGGDGAQVSLGREQLGVG